MTESKPFSTSPAFYKKKKISNHVTLGNDFARAVSSLNLDGLHMMAYVLYQIDSSIKAGNSAYDLLLSGFEVDVHDFSETIGVDQKNPYRFAKRCADNLKNSNFYAQVLRDDGKLWENDHQQIASNVLYRKGESRLVIEFDKYFLQFVTKIEDRFAQVKFSNLVELQNEKGLSFKLLFFLLGDERFHYGRSIAYTTKQLYVVLSSKPEAVLKNIEELEFEFKYFNQRMLKPALLDIEAHTDFDIDVKHLKEGRSTVAIEFVVNYKKSVALENEEIEANKEETTEGELVEKELPDNARSINKVNSSELISKLKKNL